jgi:hypothetical protein
MVALACRATAHNNESILLGRRGRTTTRRPRLSGDEVGIGRRQEEPAVDIVKGHGQVDQPGRPAALRRHVTSNIGPKDQVDFTDGGPFYRPPRIAKGCL